MPLNFPANPAVNDTYTYNGVTYTFNGNLWSRSGAGAGGATVTVANTVPTATTEGSLWLDNDNGDFYVRFGDAWATVGGGGSGPTGATGAAGAIGATGPAGPLLEPIISSVQYPTGYTSLDVYGGETVTIVGSNFYANSNIIIDTSPCNVTVANSTHITFTSPIKNDGEYTLFVTNFDGRSRVKPLAVKYVTRGIQVNVLMVAGGGSGGTFIGAGGGAGGILTGNLLIPLSTYTVVVGAGATNSADGTSGGNTTFAGFTSIGGGGAYTYQSTNGAGAGLPGGSGGGGAGNRGGTSPGGAALQTNQTNAYGTLTGYGFAGGIGTASGDPIQPAGGGGAGSLGGNGQSSSPTKAGDGGDGIYNNIRTGANVGYGGGGSGQPYNSAANPTNKRDTFGGGVSTGNDVVSGVVNTGGGGGGAGFAPYSGPSIAGTGGSGIVVVRYAGNSRGTGGSITSITVGNISYTVHSFTTSGNLVIT